MIAMTTKSSTRVNPQREYRRDNHDIFVTPREKVTNTAPRSPSWLSWLASRGVAGWLRTGDLLKVRFSFNKVSLASLVARGKRDFFCRFRWGRTALPGRPKTPCPKSCSRYGFHPPPDVGSGLGSPLTFDLLCPTPKPGIVSNKSTRRRFFRRLKSSCRTRKSRAFP